MDSTGLAGVGYLVIIILIWAVYLGYPLISVLFGLYIRRKIRAIGKKSKIANLAGFTVMLILLLLPFADYPWYRHTVDQYCSQEAGFHITNSVEAVEGVHGLRHAIDYGYSYGEVYGKQGDPSSLHRYYAASPGGKKGKFLKVKTDKLSQYGFRRDRVQVDGSIFRVTLQTYITKNGNELGRFVYFENDPREQGVSFNDFRKWMRMTCDGVEPGAFPQMRKLLKNTLNPSRLIPK